MPLTLASNYYSTLPRGVQEARQNPFARSAHHAEGVNIINSEGIAYHQHEVLYIIKPQENPAPKGLMRYKGGLPPLMIYTALRVSMIYQACGLDKKIPKANAFGIFWRRPHRSRRIVAFFVSIHSTRNAPCLGERNLEKTILNRFFVVSKLEPTTCVALKCGSISKTKSTRFGCFLFWRRHSDLNRGIEVLQTCALPLGHGAEYFVLGVLVKNNIREDVVF